MFRICRISSFVGNKAKWRILKRVFQENKTRQIFRKTNISYPLIRTRTCVYQGEGNVCFGGKFGVLCFLETPVLRLTLLPYYRRIKPRWIFPIAYNDLVRDKIIKYVEDNFIKWINLIMNIFTLQWLLPIEFFDCTFNQLYISIFKVAS